MYGGAEQERRRPQPVARRPANRWPARSTATAPYPAASFSPIARPRRAGPTRSIFMMTVVDQVSPWLTPSSTLAATTHHQVGAQISIAGTGSATSQPATSTGLRPKRSDRVPAKKLVTALTSPKATMKRQPRGEARRGRTSARRAAARRCAPGRASPPTRALTATSSDELGQVRPQPEPHGAHRPAAAGSGRCLRRCAHAVTSSALPVAVAHSSAPAVTTATPRVTGALEDARCGGGALAVPAHRDDRPGRQVSAGQRAELDVAGAGQVAVGVLAGLPDVDDRPGRPARRPAGGGGDRLPGGGPGGDAAGELADEVVVADLAGLPDDLVGVLVGVADEHQWRRRVGHEPAQPGRERRPQGDGERAGEVPGGVVGRRTHVDDLGAGAHPQHSSTVSGGSAASAGGRAGPRRFTSASRRKYGGYVPRLASSMARTRPRPARRAADWPPSPGRWSSSARRPGCRAERPGAVCRLDRVSSGQRGQPVQRGVLGPGQLLGALGPDQVGAGRRADEQRPAGEHPGGASSASSSR